MRDGRVQCETWVNTWRYLDPRMVYLTWCASHTTTTTPRVLHEVFHISDSAGCDGL